MYCSTAATTVIALDVVKENTPVTTVGRAGVFSGALCFGDNERTVIMRVGVPSVNKVC